MFVRFYPHLNWKYHITLRIETTSAFITVFVGRKSMGYKQAKNPCQPGLRPDVSAAHPHCYGS